MIVEPAAGRRDPAIHPGVRAAVTAVYDTLGELFRVHQALLPSPDDAVDHFLAARGVEPLSFLRPDSAALRPDPPFALPPEAVASPLGQLRDALRLSLFETALLALALLPELDEGSEFAIGYFQGDALRIRPTLGLALRLFAPDYPLRCVQVLGPEAPLRAWELLEPPPHEATAIRSPLRLERALLWRLLGADAPDPALADIARALPTAEAAAVDLPEVLAYLLHPAHRAVGPILLYGAAAPAALAMALAAAGGRGQDLLLLDGERLARAGEDGPRLLRRGLREALLRGLLPCVGAAAPLVRRSAPAAAAYRRVLDASPCPVLLLGDGEGEEAYAVGDGGLCAVAIPAPDATTRLAQWQRAAAREGIAADTPALRVLAETTALCGPALDAAADLARAAAKGQGEQPTATHLQRAARGALRDGDAPLEPLEPRFGWDDLVLPPVQLAQLRHLCNRVRYRSRVREEWDLGHGTLPGVVALFTGAPGTGKSLAAEVVAADLGLALYKVDLSQTVNKYIGETEKTLGGLFDAAERLGVALVFDEADALFGKRSAVQDSHDRYANLETSYLLQRLERFSGLAMLTTNLGANLDEAFTRRLAVSVEFPLPGAADRLRLWERLLGRAPRDPALDLRVLAERVELAGGAIMGAAVAAGYLAAEADGVIDGARLGQAVRWELRKAGRLVDNAAMEALLPAPAPPPGDREGANGIVYPRH